MGHPPTAEQDHAIALALTGEPLVIQAGAGTGKSSTLAMIAERMPDKRLMYVAFNKSIVTDAAGKFPSNTEARTAHSLAHTGIVKGTPYANRLQGGSKRMSPFDLAKAIGARELAVATPFGPKRLAAGFLASLATRTVQIFCQTDDVKIGPWHVPRQDGLDEPTEDGRRGPVMQELASEVARLAQLMWADISKPTGCLPFDHGHYLKLWSMADPKIAADVVLLDECQPPDTMVEMAGGAPPKRIIDIAVGDRVASYRKGNVFSRLAGSRVSGKTVGHHEGRLLAVSAGERVSRYTPNHICMARIGDAFAGKTLLYLMKSGGRWRIGVTKDRHGTGPGRTTGIMGRLREEAGEAAWLLAVYGSRAEAEAAEQLNSLIWRIPQVRFSNEQFWKSWDCAYSNPEGLLASFGRMVEYPLIGRERRYMLADRFTEIRACNLMDGMQVRADDGEYHPLTVWEERYQGPVVSLKVDGPATYIADGIVTHNCQDLNPTMMAIAKNQTNAQLIVVGDSSQAIYSWNGAVDALDKFDITNTAWLTKSFRFGPAVAEVANEILALAGAPLRLTGTEARQSVVTAVRDGRRTILGRTNGLVVREALSAIRSGVSAHVVGGAKDVIAFAEAAGKLKGGRTTYHHDLACFQSWGDVQTYVDSDPLGEDLRLLVRLVDEFGVDALTSELKNQKPMERADLVCSTAHKAKGLEWDRVCIGSDFTDPEKREISEEEKRLTYVAVTRAMKELDVASLPLLKKKETA